MELVRDGVGVFGGLFENSEAVIVKKNPVCVSGLRLGVCFRLPCHFNLQKRPGYC